MNMNEGSMLSFVSLALQAVSARVTLLLAMSMTFGLFCWAMWAGTSLALCVAGSFAVLVFLPTLLRGSHDQAQSKD